MSILGIIACTIIGINFIVSFVLVVMTKNRRERLLLMNVSLAWEIALAYSIMFYKYGV